MENDVQTTESNKKNNIYNFFQQKYVSLTSFGLNWFIIHHTFGTLTFHISSYFSTRQNNKKNIIKKMYSL